MMRLRLATSAGLLAAAALAGCIVQPQPVMPAATSLPAETATSPPTADTATATPIPATPPAAPLQEPPDYRPVRHATGVFSLILPSDWLVLDRSTDERLLVYYVPPAGYGSRVTVDVTNEGPLTPDEVRDLAESYVHLNYASQPGYAEISRAELPDGRLQFVFQFNDGHGVEGRETLTIRQAGSYFAALRTFLVEDETATLGPVLDAIMASFGVDPLAFWAGMVESISAADLPLVGTTLWRDRDGITHYMGEVTNASTLDVSGVQVRIALCDEAGIVMAELVEPAALGVVAAGSSTPFAVSAADMPSNVAVCAEQAEASPARPDPTYTSTLALEPVAGFDEQERVVIQGRVTNRSLSPVTDVEVILLVYDRDDRVVGYQVIAFGPETTLAPGEAAPFEHTFPEVGGIASRFVTLAQARVVSEQDPSLSPDSEGG